MAYTQDTRSGELKAPAGLEALVLKRFVATEGISELFEFRIEAVSESEGDLDIGTALGKDCTVTIKSFGQDKRHFVGVLADARHLNSSNSDYKYLLVLRPWIYLMSKRINSKVYTEKSATDILKAIVAEYGRTGDYHFQNTYPKLEYCVQHNESDLDFFLRLMESNGISYHFKFEDGTHTIVLTDHDRDDMPGSLGAKRPYIQYEPNAQRTQEHVHDWMPQRHFTTGKVTTTDYNFLASTTSLLKDKSGDAEFTPGTLEHYEHPYNLFSNKYVTAEEGTAFATARLDSLRAADKRAIAAGDALTLTPGYIMELEKHDLFSAKYLVVRCSHHYEAPEYSSNGAVTVEPHYSGIYEVMPKDQNFAPPIITPRPVIPGVQTGTVVVIGGGEIDCDEYGRILVHLHWNREDDQTPEGHTMRARVVHALAGKEWGSQYLPRKGMEVLVQFVDGDPDRPVVVGCVYNNVNMPPYKPKTAEKNITGIKTRSTESGGTDDYNELVMDDTKGSELVRFHAQKDLDSTVEHDETRQIQHDRTTTIDNDETYTIKHDRSTTITNNDTLVAKNEISITATTKITLTCGQSTIVIEPASISITSVEIKTTAKAMATHDGGGMMIIKAGMVQIN